MEEGKDVLDPLLVVQPPLDQVSTCHQHYRPCRVDTNSERPQMTSKTLLTGCQVGPPDSCTPMKLKGSDLMCCHTVVLWISLSVGFLDSLHDPSAYVAPHDSTPEGRAAEGGTPEGRAVSVTRELDLSLLCRIWLFGRHLVSLAKIAEVWPPFF